ncbi:MAG TPA: FAD-binding oxidoreductase [Asanoa sp.]
MRPTSVADAAELIRKLADDGRTVRPAGAGSRAGWGGTDPQGTVAVGTAALDKVVAHNTGDFTAVFQAGVPLAAAQRALAAEGQWLAVDPPDAGGTIGGLVATADSGPARHRYGGVRDLVIGITVVLCDGTIARSGGTVIKNVAGYDLGKLFVGSYGTLGLVAEVAVRLHPLPTRTATVLAETGDPASLGALALALSKRPLEAASLDAAWHDGRGRILLRFAGVTAPARARAAAASVAATGPVGDATVVDDDDALWAAQRAGQRRPDGAVLKVSGLPTDLPVVIAAAEAAGAAVVSRAALGLSWLGFEGGDLADRLRAARAALAPRACAVLDGAHLVDAPLPAPDPAVRALAARVKSRFDPAGAMRPGVLVGGAG